MASAHWTRSNLSDAAQIAAAVDADEVPDGAAGQAPHEWFAALMAEGKLNQAIDFVAHALPRYECAVWAAQALLATGAVDRQDPPVVAVLRWIDEPSDKLRRICDDAAEEAKDGSPGRLLARAVAISGGSIAPEDLPPILPPPDACGKLASAALLTGAYALPDPKAALRHMLSLGEAMAVGG